MLLRCSSLCLIISDCTLSCLCLMVEEQITEGSLSESWWPGQWSWQRRASGGTLHNRQQEPQPGGARDQPPETLSSHSISSWFSMFNFNCLMSTALETENFAYPLEAFFSISPCPISALTVFHPSRIYDFVLTRCSAAHAVLCQAFSGNHSSKSFHTMRIRIPFHLSYQYLLQKQEDTEDASK